MEPETTSSHHQPVVRLLAVGRTGLGIAWLILTGIGFAVRGTPSLEFMLVYIGVSTAMTAFLAAWKRARGVVVLDRTFVGFLVLVAFLVVVLVL